jgi:PEGA domain
MTRQRFTVSALVVAMVLAVSVLPVLAQGRERPAGAASTGTAEPRGGGGGGGGGNVGSGASGGSMGSSSTPSSSGSSSAPSSAPPGRSSGSAPERYGAPRRGGEGSAGRAVPRGSNGDGSPAGGRTAATRSEADGGDNSSPEQRAAVPVYARPRDGRPVTGQAVERGTVHGGNGNIYYPYYPYYPGSYYYPYGYWGSYGFGLGYLYYDPFWSGGYGYSPGYYGGYGYGYGGSGGYTQSVRDTGSLRLKIKPRQAQVFVDGYFVGEVDSFDGMFQKLGIDSGGHKIEIKADGYEPAQFDVLVTPGETVTYKGELKRIQ